MRCRSFRRGPASRRVGFLEGIRDGALVGWAHDPDAAGEPALLRITAGDGWSRLVTADHYRADVQAAGHGDGICGFALPLPAPATGEWHCCWADSGVALGASPWRAATAKPLIVQTGTIVLRLDPPTRGSRTLSGGAVDRTSPRRRLDLVLALGDLRSAPARACRHAPAMTEFGSDGFHGFLLAAGAGAAPYAEIREADTDRTLLRLSRTWTRTAGLA